MDTIYDHLVLVSLDTLRSDAISASPSKLWPLKYPNLRAPRTRILDEFATKAAFFPNCVSVAPYTSTSHATIITGQWPLHHGVREFFNRRLRSNTLFRAAQRSGRRTLLKTDFPLILGPTLGFDDAVDDFIIEDDAAFLAALRRSQRSVSLVHFAGIHIPYGFHNLRYGGRAYRAKVEAFENEFGPAADLPKDQLVETYRDKEDLFYLLRYKRIIQELWQSGQAARIFGLYLEGIEHFLATRFEPFITRLYECLVDTRWLMVVFGDHGEEYDSESFGHFNSVAEGVLRVPLMFLGSDVLPGTYRKRVRTLDILATLSELMPDLHIGRASLDGESLVRSVREGDEPTGNRTSFAQAYVADTAAFIRFQQRLVARGEKRGVLPHVLFKEAVYEGDFKLTRQHYDYGSYLGSPQPIPTITRLERFDKEGVPETTASPSVSATMESLLDKYGALWQARRRASRTDT